MNILKVVVTIMLVLNICTVEVASQKTPMFYGWFFNEIIAAELKNVTDNYLSALYGSVKEVKVFLKNISSMRGIEDPLQYYTKPVDPITRKYDPYFHITAFYCGADDCSSYTKRVSQYLNHIFITHLVGVFFTARTYGIRVNLTNIQNELFWMTESKRSFYDLSSIKENDDIDKTKSLGGIEFCPQDDNNFHPTDTRAHVTLGCAPNVTAVTTGLDLIEILKLEMEPSRFCAQFHVEQGNLIQMGDNCDTFVYYLKDKMVANSTFEVYYNGCNSKTLAGPLQYCTFLFLLIFILFK